MTLHFKPSLLLCSILSGALLLPHIASANAPQHGFYPITAWNIGQTSADNDGQNSVQCAIQNEFNNGFILRINGSANWVENVQIDFRQRIFEDNQAYDVKMTLPGIVSETMSANTQGGNIISVDLRPYKDFYKSLKETGVFDFAIEGNEFRFYTTGLNTQASLFEDCMANAEKDLYSLVNIDVPAIPEPAIINESVAFEKIEAEHIAMSDPVSISASDSEFKPVPIEEKIAANSTQEEGQSSWFSGFFNNNTVPPADDMNDENYADHGDDAVSVVATEMPTQAPIELIPTLFEENMEAEVEVAADVEIDIASVANIEVEPENEPIKVIYHYETPEIKVTKSIGYAKMDIRDIDVVEAISQEIVSEKTVSDTVAASYFDASEIEALHLKISKLENQNEALNDEIQNSIVTEVKEQVSISTNNWNLERATMRYNEAERQLNAIGRRLKRERTACSMEKRELETMLFDPAVTSEAQLAKLANLEAELTKTKAELDAIQQ